MNRQRITVQEVADNPTNAFQVTVHGDAAIKRLRLHGEGAHAWTYIEYVNGGSCAGEPAHWHTYVRVTD
jgi:hypothetical protein